MIPRTLFDHNYLIGFEKHLKSGGVATIKVFIAHDRFEEYASLHMKQCAFMLLHPQMNK